MFTELDMSKEVASIQFIYYISSHGKYIQALYYQ